MKYFKSVKEGLKRHIVDSTAMVAASTPIFASIELLSGMSNDVSIKTRAIIAGLTFAGFGAVYSKGRDMWMGKFNKSSAVRATKYHDAAYCAATAVAVNPFLYMIAGSRDFNEIALSTAGAMAIGTVNGAIMGYAMEILNDFTGLEDSKRLLPLVKNQNSSVKKGLAALLIGSSLGITSAMYMANHDSPPNQNMTYTDISDKL